MTNNILQKDYTTLRSSHQLRLPLDTDILIPSNDKVRLLNAIMEELDYSQLYRAYSQKGRNPATSPVTLFKLIVYGNMDGKYSSRAIEKACKRDINYMWLLGEEGAPNHFEIARFRSQRLAECCEGLFYQLVEKLKERGVIKYEHLFVDGTKIEANANKYSFVWKKSTNKYQLRLNKKIDELIMQINKTYEKSYTNETDLHEIYNDLTQKKTVEFVNGKGKRKTQLQRDIETLEEYIAKSMKYEKYQNTFNGRNSFSKTDPDATFMHMKEDHMRNSQLKPGYNIQLAVEGEFIAGVDVSSERSDQLTMIPLLEKMYSNLGERHKTVTADAGYESEENYSYFEGKGMPECYIKPQNYEKSKSRKFKQNMNRRENMPYDADQDAYTCQNGKKLKAVYTGKRVSTSGFESQVTYYECESCDGCEYKKGCTRSKGNRKIQVSKKFIEQRRQSLEKITSPFGIQLRINRSIQAEGAFGVIKEDYGFRRFLLRGSKKVMIEILLHAMGYNVNKLHNKIQQNRTGTQLHEKLIA